MTINNNLKKIALALLWGGGLINAEAGFSVIIKPQIIRPQLKEATHGGVVNCSQKQCRKLKRPSPSTVLPPLPNALPTQRNAIMESQLSENDIESLLNRELINNARTEEILPLLSANLAMYGIDEKIGFFSQKIRDFQLLNSDGTLSDEFKNLDDDKRSDDFSYYLDISVNPVTRWFVRKFFEGEDGKPIIFFDNKAKNHFSDISTKQFMLSFLKIADNPVGRNLLFGILSRVEQIRGKRPLPFLNYYNRFNKPIPKIDMKKWTKMSHLSVHNDGEGFSIEVFTPSVSEARLKLPCPWKTHNYSEYLSLPAINDVDGRVVNAVIPYELAIFHEFIHWFQYLYDPIRSEIEKNDAAWRNIDLFGRLDEVDVTTMGRYSKLWSDIDHRSHQITEIWEGCFNHNGIGFYEMRVILGELYTSPDVLTFLDFISENAMRILLNCPVRLGCNLEDFTSYDLVENKKLRSAIYKNTELLFSKIGLHNFLIK
ncbi:MAG: hypothetical protein LBJ96_05290 [Holosporaceae bacterium]|jgi:hypothetical protein|nr:hypothetical protein [Holosporaceae bacterium]